MALWGIKNSEGGAFADIIRCDEPSYLIWKWRPEGVAAGTTNKENSIRWGSSLRVREGSLAVFVYNTGSGARQDFIEGPYDGLLDTNNLPVLSGLQKIAYNGGTPFQAEVYFINLAEIITAKFAVPYFDCFDPRFEDLAVPVAVRGTMNFKISDVMQFIKLHRLDNFTVEDLISQVRDTLTRTAKSVVANAPSDFGIPVTQLESRIEEISERVEERIADKLNEKYAVSLTELSISNIEADKESPAYKRLEKMGQASTSAAMVARRAAVADTVLEKRNKWVRSTAEADADAEDIRFDQKLGAVSRASKLVSVLKEDRRDDRERAIERTASFLGDAGRNIAGGIRNAVNAKKNKEDAPPPVPAVMYHVAEKGQSTGPFDLEELHQQVLEGKLTKESLVWKKGMETWSKAGEIEELEEVFKLENEMPPIPVIAD